MWHLDPNVTDDEFPLIARIVGYLGVTAAIVLSTWMTVIAFIGGTMPIIGLETRGGLVPGLVWLFFIDPIVITLAYWATMVVAVPLALLFGKRPAEGPD